MKEHKNDTLLRKNIGLLPYAAVRVENAMRDAVADAVAEIRKSRTTFVANPKNCSYKKGEDMLTDTDLRVQEMYVGKLRALLPGIGFVCEEDNVSEPCSLEGLDAYFTIDPLDGTKAYARLQSDSVGTMLSLVVEGQVVAAYVGDAISEEIYGYCAHPDSESGIEVRRTVGLEAGTVIDPKIKPLAGHRCFLPSELDNYPEWIRRMVAGPERLFGSGMSSLSGSIGTNLARLWKGEVGMFVMAPYASTPWDETPLLGISWRLGFEVIDDMGIIQGKRGFAHVAIPLPWQEIQKRKSCRLFVHKNDKKEFLQWLESKQL